MSRTRYPRWTKETSRRAVTAKEAKRLDAAKAEPDWGREVREARRCRKPLRGPAKFTIVVRDGEHGDRLQMRFHRLPDGRLQASNGQTPTAFCNALRVLITHAA